MKRILWAKNGNGIEKIESEGKTHHNNNNNDKIPSTGTHRLSSYMCMCVCAQFRCYFSSFRFKTQRGKERERQNIEKEMYFCFFLHSDNWFAFQFGWNCSLLLLARFLKSIRFVRSFTIVFCFPLHFPSIERMRFDFRWAYGSSRSYYTKPVDISESLCMENSSLFDRKLCAAMYFYVCMFTLFLFYFYHSVFLPVRKICSLYV